MTRADQVCSLDSSMLVYLYGSVREGGLDLAVGVGYCPRCDVAFVSLAPGPRTAAPPAVLRWYRREGQFELREEDRGRWSEVPRRFREHWESELRQGIDRFLRGRHSAERPCCPIDGTRNPVIHRWQDQAGVGWLMTWCGSCGKAFLFASDPDYGWEGCAGLAWDAGHQAYELAETYPTGAGHAVGPHLVRALPPLPALMSDAIE